MENNSSVAEADVVNALLECLVDPFLPLEKKSVAKQMHAVVLLYNYYQRKQDPERDYVGFESFCKLAVTLRPSLKLHMKHTHDESPSSNSKDYVDDLDNLLSETEKAILEACNISLVLNPLKENPNTEKWPLSKVAVLLVDCVKQNCCLSFGSVTEGIWSLIEKVVDITSESKGVGKRGYKRKGINKKILQEEKDADYQQLAFSAIKEATGINEADLMVLETHVVYSLSKEKTAVQFYIVQCTQSVQEDIQYPLKDLIESLQGPLVKRTFGDWMTTTVVKYYHMLPYATILSNWLSRQEVYSKKDSKSSQQTKNKRAEEEKEVGQMKQVLSNTRQKQNLKGNVKSDNNIRMLVDANHHHEQNGTDADKSSSFSSPQKDDETKNMCMEGNADHLQKRKRTCSIEQGDMNALTSSVDLKAEGGKSKMKPIASECRCDKGIEKKLSDTALKVLHRKREKLTHQLRTLEDEIAVCDQTIQAILYGGDDDMALRLHVLIDCCNESEGQNEGNSFNKGGQQQCLSRQLKQNRLGETSLCLPSPHQELNDISK